MEAKRAGEGLSSDEELELQKWIAGNAGVWEELGDREKLLDHLKVLKEFEDKARIDSILSATYVQQDGEVQSAPRKLNIKVWLRYAAVLVPLFAISVAYLWNNFSSNSDRNVMGATTKVIVPATERAILTLSDGRSIAVDENTIGEIARQGNAVITKTSGGQITYANADRGINEQFVNTLTTPRGGYFQLQLADGSRVWLNAASSIRFPASFSDPVREVEISGEVYFEVAENKNSPFRVKINDRVQVEVLGTRFNLRAYELNGNVEATLLSGSVRLTTKNQDSLSSSVKLKPLQRAVYAADGHKVLVSQSDTADITAWRQGLFNFGTRPLSATLAEVGRWYDVEFEYRGTASNSPLWGSIDRQISFEKLLEFLSKSGLKYEQVNPGKIVVTDQPR
jgi:transmembrane sensor